MNNQLSEKIIEDILSSNKIVLADILQLQTMDLLNRHKIRELWHVLTYDKDFSDDKITEIGSHRAILYLPDDSPK